MVLNGHVDGNEDVGIKIIQEEYISGPNCDIATV